MPATTTTASAADDAVELGQQPLRTGDADIDDQIRARSHPIGRFANLFGDGDVTGSGGDDGDKADVGISLREMAFACTRREPLRSIRNVRADRVISAGGKLAAAELLALSASIRVARTGCCSSSSR